MSISSDKSSTLNGIATVSSIGKYGNIPQQSNTFTSVNNSNDTISFLLDALSVTAGSTGLQVLMGELFVNFAANAEEPLKLALKKQFQQQNSTTSLSQTSFNANGSGIPLDVKSIDLKRITDDNSSLLLNKSKPNFDNNLKNSISSESTVEYNGLSMKYSSISDKLVVKPTTATANLTIGDWFGNFIDNTTIIDNSILMANVMNAMYGTIDINSNKTVQQLYDEQQTSQLLNNLGNDDDSLELTQNELSDLMNKSENLKKGVITYDLGCGVYEVSLTIDDLTNLVSTTSGSTDPNFIGNAVANTFSGSVSTNSDSTITDENKEVMKDGFIKRIIDAIKKTIIESITTSPQIRTLLSIFSAIQNNGVVSLTKPAEDFKKFKTLIKCLTDAMKTELTKFIYFLVISYLIKILAPIVKVIIKEKINNYLRILKSLV